MRIERRILEKAGIDDPTEVFENRSLHLKNRYLKDFVFAPEKMKVAHREEVRKHLNFCDKCQKRKGAILPLEGQI